MNVKEFLESITPLILKIGPNEKTLSNFKEIIYSMEDTELIDSFFQLKKNDKGQGLAFEIMFFNKMFIYDIVVTNQNIEFITVKLSSVNMISVDSLYGESENSNGDVILTDSIKLTISYGGNIRGLGYSTESRRFSEVTKIKSKLLNLISVC